MGMIFREAPSYILVPVRRGLVRTGAWAAATAAAVAVSWFGVHSVLADSSAVQPRPLVLGVNAPVPSPTAPPPPTAIGVPVQTPSATPSSAPATAVPSSPAPHRAASSPRTPTPPPPASTDQVVSYTRPGGIIVVSVGPDSAKLITATPDPGWSVQTWTSEPDWFRVDFVRGGTDTVFYMTWNGHPPMVQD